MRDASTSAVETLTYRLSSADAFAWEILPGEVRGWRRVALLVWLGCGGFTVALLPKWMVGPENSIQFYAVLLAALAVQYALAAVWMTLVRHLRARRRFPHPVSARLEIRGDRLAETRTDRFRSAVLIITPDLIRQVILTDRHVFINSVPGLLILPVAAFADEGRMRTFAAHWDGLSRAAAP